ncbi:hypothetical protein [Francisella sp. LA112445]|uniref:hypothetical protein n=1 Tax=Francisella sp. LA112445 TaxID=1395624 RepID=UPI001788AA35|nr:hypothetical protein [Francisella sp. LA112445]QIW09681.1 hypothetical protein FIP56_02910 [Francisella sp. LA112445]
MIKFISIEVLKDAFIRGLDNFIEVYKLQLNENSDNSDVKKTNLINIPASEVEYANRIKTVINRNSNYRDFFNIFGKKLQRIAKETPEEIGFTSSYFFIVLAVFYYASINYDALNTAQDKRNFDMKKVIKSYFKLCTSTINIAKNLYWSIGEALTQVNIRLIDNDKFNSQFAHHSYINRSRRIISSKDNLFNLKSYNIKNHKETTNFINIGVDQSSLVISTFYKSRDLLIKLNLISKAILAYNLRSKENNNVDRNKVFEVLDNSHIDLLSLLHPPGLIDELVSNIRSSLVKITTKSKFYYMDKYGEAESITSILLKSYIDMIIVFIKNHYYSIFLAENLNESQNYCKIISEVIKDFESVYQNIYKKLPNKHKKNSLVYYLDIYINPYTSNI